MRGKSNEKSSMGCREGAAGPGKAKGHRQAVALKVEMAGFEPASRRFIGEPTTGLVDLCCLAPCRPDRRDGRAPVEYLSVPFSTWGNRHSGLFSRPVARSGLAYLGT